MNEKRSLSVVFLVIGTMAAVVIGYAICLFCLSRSVNAEISGKAIEQFKDLGIYAAGALTAFLARTGTTPTPSDQPVKTEVVNKPSNPIPTNETKSDSSSPAGS